MKLHPTIGFASILCMMLASCYPIQDSPRRGTKRQGKTQAGATVPLTPEQQKAKEAADLKKKEDLKKQEDLKKEQEDKNPENTRGTGGTTGGTTGEKPPAPPQTDYQYANKVPGKEGFVFSPYNNKVVDVRDIPSGTLVQDPTYPVSEKKYFRVP